MSEPASPHEAADLGFDPDALRAKYRAERSVQFFQILQDWRAAGGLKGLELSLRDGT
jgi:hypothetical protein